MPLGFRDFSSGGFLTGGAGSVADPIIPSDGEQNITGDFAVSGDSTFSGDAILADGSKLYFDGGTNGYIDHASGVLRFYPDGNLKIEMKNGNTDFYHTVQPNPNNAYNMGGPTRQWLNVYGASYWAGTALLNAYGHIADAHDDAPSTTQTVEDSFELYTGWDTNGLANGATADQANNRIAVTAAGTYKIDFHVSFSADAADLYEWAIYSGTIASTVVDSNCSVHRKVSINDEGSCSGTTVLALTAGQVVELWVRSDDAPGSALSVYNAGLVVTCLGA